MRMAAAHPRLSCRASSKAAVGTLAHAWQTVTLEAMKGDGKAIRRAARTGPASRDAAMVAVLMQFRVVLRSIRRHYRSVELECGVTGAQLWALAQIESEPGIRLTDLAKALAIHQTTATNIIDNLVELRLVERRRQAGDLRVTHLFLTAKGKRTVARAPRPLRGVLQQALLDLPESTLRGLGVHLEELLRHVTFRDTTDRTLPLSDVEATPRRRR